MRKTFSVLAILFLGSVSSVFGGGKAFLTEDLMGWEGLIDPHWSYRNGVLTGSAPMGLKFNTFLCSKKKYTDFELSFQVKLTGKSPNSGVQIRSEIEDKQKFAVRGPQCDMGAIYWGSLYGELFGGMMQAASKEIVSQVLKKDDFNDYSIKCVKKHVTIKLNGAVTVDADFDKMPPEGIIAFQLHAGPPMEAIFKNIQFKDLTIPEVDAKSKPDTGQAFGEYSSPGRGFFLSNLRHRLRDIFKR